jgi:hypothetical protein
MVPPLVASISFYTLRPNPCSMSYIVIFFPAETLFYA